MKAARSPLTPTDSTDPRAAPGLRERKKLKTRAAIRRATFALISEHGYEATTVEQIAEAAEVSPSTVIRYFPAKEDIVLTDEQTPALVAALRARPADEPVLESLRHTARTRLRAVLVDGDAAEREEMLLRTRLLVDVPAVRARVTESLTATGRQLCPVIAERAGLPPDDLSVRAFTTAVTGALLEATLYWTEHDRRDDLADLFDAALGVFGERAPDRP